MSYEPGLTIECLPYRVLVMRENLLSSKNGSQFEKITERLVYTVLFYAFSYF
jgi:hypothetical protein